MPAPERGLRAPGRRSPRRRGRVPDHHRNERLGKSTLLNAIAGTFLPDRGTITIGGEDMAKKQDFHRARFISRVFQNPFMGTAPDMTIAENIHLAFMRGKPRYPVPGLTRERLAVYREKSDAEMQLENRLDNTIGTLPAARGRPSPSSWP
jgi:putative ABC transport system ATP-binding protein